MGFKNCFGLLVGHLTIEYATEEMFLENHEIHASFLSLLLA
jgi:hypothetical protein